MSSITAPTRPGGVDAQVQFNDGGVLGGDAGLAFYKSNRQLWADSIVLPAGQIRFPVGQNATPDATTFDDYREGAWVPTLGGAGGASGQSYTLQAGAVTKIGNTVLCSGRIVVAAVGTISGEVVLALPYAAKAVNHYPVGILVFAALATPIQSLKCRVAPGVSYAHLIYLPVGGGASEQFVYSNLLASGTDLNFSIQYQTE